MNIISEQKKRHDQRDERKNTYTRTETVHGVSRGLCAMVLFGYTVIKFTRDFYQKMR